MEIPYLIQNMNQSDSHISLRYTNTITHLIDFTQALPAVSNVLLSNIPDDIIKHTKLIQFHGGNPLYSVEYANMGFSKVPVVTITFLCGRSGFLLLSKK